MTKEQSKQFSDKRAKFIFDETEELRSEYVEVLGLKEGYTIGLKQNEIKTLGDLIDNWDKLEKLNNIGVTKVRNIRAAMFAYLMELGVVKDVELVTV